ncbi:primosomal protein N' [Moorellaceae bacterium AZ2]
MLVNVLVNSALQRVTRPLTYEVPLPLEREIALGARVVVSVGRREVEGIVIGFPVQTTINNLKFVREVLDKDFLPPSLVELLLWISEYYLCLPGEVLPLVMPPLLKRRGYSWRWVGGKEEGLEGLTFIGPLAGEIAAYLARRGEVSERQLRRRWAPQDVVAALRELEQRGFAVKLRVAGGRGKAPASLSPKRIPTGGEEREEGPGGRIVLNQAQRTALRVIQSALEMEGGNFLLHGITGSGKTEVYIRSIAAALQRNKGAIILVPEHALIPQMVERLRGAFADQVVVIHGELAPGERTANWHKIRQGEAMIAVGTRSALFAPFQKLGLIIVDEEHAPTYKHEATPRYDAREVALKRGQLERAVVIFGTATPSTEAYFLACRGQLQLLELNERVAGSSPPKIKIIDMREEFRSGHCGYFSRELQREIGATLARGEQVLLFLNRRGYAPHVVCRYCGYVPACHQCAVSLTYHADGKLRCHYCGLEVAWQGTCPHCGGSLALLGIGTQRVEAEVRAFFPKARLLRADSDTTGTPGRWAEVYHQFACGRADILIGTQTIAKGMDFEGVTLVGVINADLSLFFPDFRARERTFQLLMQVAGRAGRRSREGKVLIQTFNPQDPAIIFAARQDYKGFYHAEIAARRLLRYPPFVKLARLGLVGPYEGEVISAAHALAKALQEAGADIEVLGPAPAAIARIRGEYRWQLTLKAPSWQQIKRGLDKGLASYKAPAGVRLIKEIGPVTMW